MDSTKDICVAHIAPFRDRDRDPERFRMLVESIDKYGLIEPIIVAPNDDAKKPYRLVAGHGRLRAVKKLGWQKVPAVIREKFELRDYVVENWRRDLTSYETAILMEHQIQMGRSVEDVAKTFCVTEPVVRQYATIVKNLHPELAKLAKKQALTMKDAHRIVRKLPEQKVQEVLIETIKRAEKVEPTPYVVKRAVEDVLGAVRVRGSTASIDTVEKLEKVREEVFTQTQDTRETMSVIRSHWLRSVGELRILLKDVTYRKLFDKHGIDYKHIVKA
jgi:ParB family chromosome partitioning protein